VAAAHPLVLGDGTPEQAHGVGPLDVTIVARARTADIGKDT
jgi:hypothetical protein